MKLNGEALLEWIKEEARLNDEDIKSSYDAGWYEKVAKLHLENEGLNKTRRAIESGDFTIK